MECSGNNSVRCISWIETGDALGAVVVAGDDDDDVEEATAVAGSGVEEEEEGISRSRDTWKTD